MKKKIVTKCTYCKNVQNVKYIYIFFTLHYNKKYSLPLLIRVWQSDEAPESCSSHRPMHFVDIVLERMMWPQIARKEAQMSGNKCP